MTPSRRQRPGLRSFWIRDIAVMKSWSPEALCPGGRMERSCRTWHSRSVQRKCVYFPTSSSFRVFFFFHFFLSFNCCYGVACILANRSMLFYAIFLFHSRASLEALEKSQWTPKWSATGAMRSRWLPDLLNIAVAQTENDRHVGSCHLWVMHTFAPRVHTFAECQTAASEYSELECHGTHCHYVIFCVLAAIL